MNGSIEDRRSERVLSPWVTLVTHSVRLPGWKATQDYHSLKQASYVAMFAVTTDGRIPLVRQYRSAIGGLTLELPSGLLEPGEDPRQTAIRELFEETGIVAGPRIDLLGKLAVDSGRLENHQWAYFTPSATLSDGGAWKPEPDVERLLVTRTEFKGLIEGGEFCHCPHMAAVGLALLGGFFSF